MATSDCIKNTFLLTHHLLCRICAYSANAHLAPICTIRNILVTLSAVMRHLLLTILLSVSLALAAQDSAFVRINRQVQLFPQEKTHIHTDAADYYPADRIWLKVYLVDATSHKPLHYAPHVYAELLSPDASILRRVKIARRDSIFAGYIDIPEDAPG